MIQLPILEEEVLCIGHPTLVHFAPSTRLGGIVPIAVVRAGCHEAPVANTSRAVVHVVQIRPPEDEMADLVSTHAELAVSGDSEVRINQSVVSWERSSVEHILVRPDVSRQARTLGTLASVHNHEGVDIAVAVVVILRECDNLVGKLGCISCHDSCIWGVVSQAVLIIRVELHGMRHSEGSHNLALDVHQAVGHITVVVPHAVGPNAEPQAVVEIDILSGVEFSVCEVYQDNRDVVDSPGFWTGSSGGRQRGSGSEGAVRTKETVVEAWGTFLQGSQIIVENCNVAVLCNEILDPLEAVQNLLSDVRVWSHKAAILHRVWKDRGLHAEHLPCATIHEYCDQLASCGVEGWTQKQLTSGSVKNIWTECQNRMMMRRECKKLR